MDREQEFLKLTQVVRQLISDDYNRRQLNLYKKICDILQIKSLPVTFKTQSMFKKIDTIDVLRKNKPMHFVGFIDVNQNGKVTFSANASSDLDPMKQRALNRMNAGSDYGTMTCEAESELIKNNPNLDVDALIETLQKKC